MKIIPRGLKPVDPIHLKLPLTQKVICGQECYAGDGIIIEEGKAFRHSFFTSPYLAVTGGKEGEDIIIVDNF